jgi:hypothetical protein
LQTNPLHGSERRTDDPGEGYYEIEEGLESADR